MTYRAPINDMLLALNHGAGLQAAVKAGHYGDFDADIAAAVLEEAGRFATDVLAPLNKVGDEHGIKLEADKVITAPGWPDAYRRWTAAGWNAVSGPEAFGGQGLKGIIGKITLVAGGADLQPPNHRGVDLRQVHTPHLRRVGTEEQIGQFRTNMGEQIIIGADDPIARNGLLCQQRLHLLRMLEVSPKNRIDGIEVDWHRAKPAVRQPGHDFMFVGNPVGKA